MVSLGLTRLIESATYNLNESNSAWIEISDIAIDIWYADISTIGRR